MVHLASTVFVLHAHKVHLIDLDLIVPYLCRTKPNEWRTSVYQSIFHRSAAPFSCLPGVWSWAVHGCTSSDFYRDAGDVDPDLYMTSVGLILITSDRHSDGRYMPAGRVPAWYMTWYISCMASSSSSSILRRGRRLVCWIEWIMADASHKCQISCDDGDGVDAPFWNIGTYMLYINAASRYIRPGTSLVLILLLLSCCRSRTLITVHLFGTSCWYRSSAAASAVRQPLSCTWSFVQINLSTSISSRSIVVNVHRRSCCCNLHGVEPAELTDRCWSASLSILYQCCCYLDGSQYIDLGK